MVECLLIELGALPRGGVVALQAVGAKTALVLVLVARGAGLAEPHPGVIELLFAQHPARGWGDILDGVAIAASCGCVLSIQDVAGLGVVESLRRGIPMEHVEVFAIVVRVALDACRAHGASHGVSGVQPVVTVNLSGNLTVALGAAEGCGARGDHVALGAVGGAIQALMRPRQRAGRDLAAHGDGEQECRDPSEQEAGKQVQFLSASICSGVHLLPCVPGWLQQSASMNAVQKTGHAQPETEQAMKDYRGSWGIRKNRVLASASLQISPIRPS